MTGSKTELEIAYECYQQSNFDKAFRVFLRSAEEGDTESMLQVALMYTRGEGVACDIENAIHWEKMALAGGNATARLNLAASFRIVGNLRESRRLYEEAISLGEDEALLELAQLLVVSDFETPNVKKLLEAAVSSSTISEESVKQARQMLVDLEDSSHSS